MGYSKSRKTLSWLTPVKDILENDYILSANTCNPYRGEEEIKHRDPKEILGEIRKLDKETKEILDKINNHYVP